jgi:hypothetical protein
MKSQDLSLEGLSGAKRTQIPFGFDNDPEVIYGIRKYGLE